MSVSDGALAAPKRQRWRAPHQDGTLLQVPPLSTAPALLTANQSRRLQTATAWSQGDWLRHLQEARRESVALARQYSSSYCDVDFSARHQETVLMTGHQPKLFHPGVWIKNFALSHLAEQHAGIAINLLIDHDLCGTSSVYVPHQSPNGRWETLPVPYDQSTANIPMELAGVVDGDLFRSFDTRLAAAIRPIVADPLVFGLWKSLNEPGRSATHRYRALAQARHRLEIRGGLATWELPYSDIAKSPAFNRFVADLALRSAWYQEIHNQSLEAFRKLYGIRGASQPVSPLISDGAWKEMPMWIYHQDDPNRRRLFVRIHQGCIELSDRNAWTRTAAPARLAEALVEWQREGTCIRPRALTTTMYSRMFLCDLFLHGIGGGWYDQLGDWVTRRFYGVETPDYLVVTATYRLPIDADAAQLRSPTEWKLRRRNLWYHPERSLGAVEKARASIERKRQLLAAAPARRTRERRNWHRELDAVNHQLRLLVREALEEVDRCYQSSLQRWEDLKVLASREVSICCHSETLVGRIDDAVRAAITCEPRADPTDQQSPRCT